MTTFNTGNPIGSTAVKDLYDNAQNLDVAVNSQESRWIDRLGKPRWTVAGIEQEGINRVDAIGYFGLDNVYAAGLTLESRSEVFIRDGQYYHLSPGSAVPYTLTGNWTTDSPKMTLLGDGAVRNELRNGGAYPVDSGVVGYKDTLPGAQLQTLQSLITGGAVSALRFIPPSLHADIRAGTSTTNVDGYLNAALALGYLIRLPQGKYRLGAPLTMTQGGGIVGEGEKSALVRNFTGGPLVRHPGGNQLDSPIILRDFSVRKADGITVASGDTGIDIGYAQAWGGRGDISNILIIHQWDGFKWKGGTMNTITNVQVHEGKGNGFLGIDARGELTSCLAQFNAGHGYFFFAQTQGETGVQFTSCGTFANAGWGFLFDAAAGIYGANIYAKGITSSFDGTGGIGFVKKYTQIWLTQVLSEQAGDAYLFQSGFTRHDDAPGLYMVGGCEQVTGSDIFIQNSRGNGALFDDTRRASFTNMTVLTSGRGGLGTANQFGVFFNANNVDVTITNLIANVGDLQTTDIGFGSNNQVDLVVPKFRTSSGGGNGIRGFGTKSTAERTIVSVNPLPIAWFGDFFRIVGNTPFNSIPASFDGRRITLLFDGTPTVFADGNIKLTANLPVTSGMTLTLICNGTNWYRA